MTQVIGENKVSPCVNTQVFNCEYIDMRLDKVNIMFSPRGKVNISNVPASLITAMYAIASKQNCFAYHGEFINNK